MSAREGRLLRGPWLPARVRRLGLIWLLAGAVIGLLVWRFGSTLAWLELSLALGFLTLLCGIAAMFEEIELRQRLARVPHAKDYSLLWIAARLVDEGRVPGVLGISQGDLVFVPDNELGHGGRWLRFEIAGLEVARAGSLKQWLAYGAGPLCLQLVDEPEARFLLLGAGRARSLVLRCLGGLAAAREPEGEGDTGGEEAEALEQGPDRG